MEKEFQIQIQLFGQKPPDPPKDPCDKERKGVPGWLKRAKQDPFWYAADQEAIIDMASFPFLESVGGELPGGPYAVPGLVVIDCYPTVGSDPFSAMNNATYSNYKTRSADAYYQYVTQGFTGGVNFEAPDLLMTALAAENIFALLCEGKRVYGLLKAYYQMNVYYSRSIVTALGYDFDDWSSHMADFRSQFNIVVDEVNKILAVPKEFFIGDRWEFLNSYLFTDNSEVEYGTAYAWKFAQYMKYNPTLMKTGTCLQWVMRPANMSVDAYFAFVRQLLAAMQDTDVRNIFGAVRRVYSDAELKKATYVTKEFRTTIAKHDIVAMQLHNAQWEGRGLFFGVAYDGTSYQLDVPCFQSASGQVLSCIGESFAPTVTPWNPTSYILDMYDHLVTPGNVLDATATMQVLSQSSQTIDGAAYYNVACRAEIIVAIHVISTAISGDDVAFKTYVSAPSPTQKALTQLDSHPILVDLQAENIPVVEGYIGEIDKYTILSRDNLTKLHDKTMYALLGMPKNNKSTTS